jgi:hypothetical protein
MPADLEPGFYTGAPDRTFFVGHAGEVWELAADAGLGVLPAAELPADAEPLERELPSMLLRVAARLGLTPPRLRCLSRDALDLLDEVFWDGRFGDEIPLDAVAELAQVGVTSTGPALLRALSLAVRGP